MKLLALSSALLLSTFLIAPRAAAQEPGLSVAYHRATSSGHLGVELQLGGPGHGRRRSHPSHHRGSPTWTYGQRAPQRVWIPGHYESVERQHWVPGTTRRVWVPSLYETRRDWLGRCYKVLVRPGHYETITEPGHWESHTEQVWVEAHWETCR